MGNFPTMLLASPRQLIRNKLPQRAVFGLPHNYYSPAARNNGASLAMNVEGPKKKVMDRRASPLFIHVHKHLIKNALVFFSSFQQNFYLTTRYVLTVTKKTITSKKR